MPLRSAPMDDGSSRGVPTTPPGFGISAPKILRSGAHVLKGHAKVVSSLAIDSDGRWLVTGSYDHTARLWDLHALKPRRGMRVLKGHGKAVSAVALSSERTGS